MTDSSLGMEGGIPDSVIQRSLIAGTLTNRSLRIKVHCTNWWTSGSAFTMTAPPRSCRKQRRGWCFLIGTKWEETRRWKKSQDVFHPSQVKRWVCSVYIQAADNLLLSVKTELAVHFPETSRVKISELWDTVDTAGEHAGRCALNHEPCRERTPATLEVENSILWYSYIVFLSHQADITFTWDLRFLKGSVFCLVGQKTWLHPDPWGLDLGNPKFLLCWWTGEMNRDCFFHNSDKNFHSRQPNLLQHNLHPSKTLNWKLCSQYMNEACDQIRDPFNTNFKQNQFVPTSFHSSHRWIQANELNSKSQSLLIPVVLDSSETLMWT